LTSSSLVFDGRLAHELTTLHLSQLGHQESWWRLGWLVLGWLGSVDQSQVENVMFIKELAKKIGKEVMYHICVTLF